jgi:hypothetical protein
MLRENRFSFKIVDSDPMGRSVGPGNRNSTSARKSSDDTQILITPD